jgi:hypothetical protein
MGLDGNIELFDSALTAGFDVTTRASLRRLAVSQ